MSGIELLPPKLRVDINTQIRLRVLAGVLYELTEVCGVNIEDAITKGIIERDVIKEIIVYFKDSNGISHGTMHFIIDWEQFEILVQTDDSAELYRGLDFSNGYCDVLDPKLLKVLKKHVAEVKKKYEIDTVKCSFYYRSKYTVTDEVHVATREYMGHIKGTEETSTENRQFTECLETVFKGMDGILRIKFEKD